MITARITVSPQGLDGKFIQDGCEYQTTCKDLETSKKLVKGVIWQCIELDGLSGRCLVEVFYDDSEKEYLDHDEFVIRIDKVVFTDEPSKFVKWGDKKPHIFTVDREKSIVVNEELNLPLGS